MGETKGRRGKGGSREKEEKEEETEKGENGRSKESSRGVGDMRGEGRSGKVRSGSKEISVRKVS